MYTSSPQTYKLANIHKRVEYKSTNCLCFKCNSTQELKLQKLHTFEESNDEVLIAQYKLYLDKIYDLCDLCKSKVKFEIRKQDGILKQYLYKLGSYEYLFENLAKSVRLNDHKKPSRISRNWSFIDQTKIIGNIFLLVLNIFLVVSNSKHFFYFYTIQYFYTYHLAVIESNNLENVLLHLLTLTSLHISYNQLHNDIGYPFYYTILLIINLILLKKISFNSPTTKIPHKNQVERMPFDETPITNIIPKFSNLSVVSSSATQQPRLIKTHSLCDVKSNFFPSNKKQIIQPPKFNYKPPSPPSSVNNDCYLNDSCRSSVSQSNRSSSSIVSGLTNLYLEKNSSHHTKPSQVCAKSKSSVYSFSAEDLQLLIGKFFSSFSAKVL
jgi:hypothetical protein